MEPRSPSNAEASPLRTLLTSRSEHEMFPLNEELPRGVRPVLADPVQNQTHR